MARIGSVCVYCGSAGSVDERYRQGATDLGTELGKRQIGLVYGGGRVGLMGLVADAAMAAGGHVTGIIPQFLQDYEVGHHGVSELLVVDTMHTRKQAMADRSDAFIVLPGGFGTLEEFFEVLTWKQLRLHDKPIIIADIGGYWGPLVSLLDHMIAEKFARPEMTSLYTVAHSVEEIFEALAAAPAPTVDPATKWA